MPRRENRADPRDVPNYTFGEVASYLRLPPATVRQWGLGLPSQGVSPLFKLAERTPPTLSFLNAVEVHVLKAIRHDHGVSLQKVRKALKYVGEQLGVVRPLIEEQFMTDGADLFIERVSSLINASRDGQTAMRAMIIGALKRIDRDDHGVAIRLFPWSQSPDEPKRFELDPGKAFGRLVIVNTRIPMDIIIERFRAGEKIGALADDLGLDAQTVEDAVQWAQRHAA